VQEVIHKDVVQGRCTGLVPVGLRRMFAGSPPHPPLVFVGRLYQSPPAERNPTAHLRPSTPSALNLRSPPPASPLRCTCFCLPSRMAYKLCARSRRPPLAAQPPPPPCPTCTLSLSVSRHQSPRLQMPPFIVASQASARPQSDWLSLLSHVNASHITPPHTTAPSLEHTQHGSRSHTAYDTQLSVVYAALLRTPHTRQRGLSTCCPNAGEQESEREERETRSRRSTRGGRVVWGMRRGAAYHAYAIFACACAVRGGSLLPSPHPACSIQPCDAQCT
jgi:hypothetical protein